MALEVQNVLSLGLNGYIGNELNACIHPIDSRTSVAIGYLFRLSSYWLICYICIYATRLSEGLESSILRSDVQMFLLFYKQWTHNHETT